MGGLASHVLDTALDPLESSVARRCGLIRTDAVATRTTVVLVRYRFHLVVTRAGAEHPILAEECATLGFTGSPSAPVWLAPDVVEPLLHARPSANVDPAQASDFLTEVVQTAGAWRTHLDDDARARARALQTANERGAQRRPPAGGTHRVEPQLPPMLRL